MRMQSSQSVPNKDGKGEGSEVGCGAIEDDDGGLVESVLARALAHSRGIWRGTSFAPSNRETGIEALLSPIPLLRNTPLERV